ncbi:MAG: DUF5518 domain-containing protein [Haloarculaceae archaeon]
MAEGDTLVNALLGALVSVILAPLIPFSPAAGGLLAGYLEGGGRDDGLRVGAISGAIALVPLLVVAVLLANVLFFFLSGTMGGPRMFGGIGLVVLLFGTVFAVAYTVGLSALGGWLGNYLKHEADVGR